MALSPVPVSIAPSMDQTADLWLKIDQFHLNYLKSDETTKKIDIRKKLEGKSFSNLFGLKLTFMVPMWAVTVTCSDSSFRQLTVWPTDAKLFSMRGVS